MSNSEFAPKHRRGRSLVIPTFVRCASLLTRFSQAIVSHTLPPHFELKLALRPVYRCVVTCCAAQEGGMVYCRKRRLR